MEKMYVLVHVCLMQSFVKLYAFGLKVTLKDIPENVESV